MSAPVSPSELLKSLLDTELPTGLIPGGVTVGPPTDTQIQAGVISIMDAGQPRTESYLPVAWYRAQMRCLAPTLEHIDRIARGAWDRLDKRNRTVVLQPSNGERYLIHLCDVGAGPSHHRDSDENYEALIFAEMLIGLDPVR
jgi:hypothetical protein